MSSSLPCPALPVSPGCNYEDFFSRASLKLEAICLLGWGMVWVWQGHREQTDSKDGGGVKGYFYQCHRRKAFLTREAG